MKKNQRGFSLVELLVLLLCLGLILLVGWYAWDRLSPSTDVDKPSNSNTSNQDTSFSIKIDPMVGGGFEGAVNSYEITATGEVFNLRAPNQRTDVKKSLLKKITLEEVKEIRQSFIESGVLDLASGYGPQYGGSVWTVTINGKEQFFYDQTSSKFDAVKIKLKKILGEDVSI